MMLKNFFVAAAAICALGTTAAVAADLPVTVPAVTDPAVSGWDGFYAGLTGAAWSELGTIYPALGVRLGANTVSGNFLLGGQVDLAYYFTSGNFDIGAKARGGVVVNDSAVIYGSLGIATLSNGSAYVPVGAGVEFKLADSVSLDLSGEYIVGFSGFTAARATTSLNWHF